MNLNKQTKVQTMPTFSEKKDELDTDDTLAGFNPKTQYAIKKLKAKYPQADNLLSALLADVEKNEDDDDSRHDMNKKHIQGLEKKLMDVIRKNGLKEEAMIVESLKENDLRGLVSPSITIDQYKSKLGKDEKIIVAGFRVKDQDPAKDLSQFIESSLNDDILDVDVSPGPNADGEYTVFVEVPRHSNAYDVLENIVNDITKVDNDFLDVNFAAYENKNPQPFNRDNFAKSVIVDARDYQLQHNPEAKAISERMKFLTRY